MPEAVAFEALWGAAFFVELRDILKDEKPIFLMNKHSETSINLLVLLSSTYSTNVFSFSYIEYVGFTIITS